ncbi:hypothetical protein [Tautonia rosea]|uniref:hypothetical protein n=1 Tax=Tautonia rosea TaxID=2728037 RepID=UPI00147453B0|nr:hypothetical protein [Tautonia rosea]
MPFQVFRRHRRKMLAALAILAMFAFVLADSLPRLFNDYARPTMVDRVVVEMGGREVRTSDLEQLRIERIRANYVLSQLALRLGGMPLVPYFNPPPFGPTDDAAMVDAMLLERKADAMGIPRTPDLARNWIFEQARMQHELYRNLQPTLPAFDPIDLAEQLQIIFNQAFGREMTEESFLAEVSDQVRILQTLELLSQSMDTPLDAFDVYRDRLVEIESRYVSFPVNDFLDKVGSPDEQTLRDFFEEYKDRLPDPTTGRVGFKIPRRVKVEYLTLGLNAIDLLREQIRGEPLEQEIRDAEGFEEDVLEQYRTEVQEREAARFAQALPVNPFAAPEDGEGVELSYPVEYEREYLAGVIDQRVQERLRDRLEDLFEPVKESMSVFSDDIGGDFDSIQTGLESSVDRERLPNLEEVFRGSDSAQSLIEVLGNADRSDEAISFVRIGLTRALADPVTFEELIDPQGIPEFWKDYLALARLEWANAPYRLLRNVQHLTRTVEGIERPDSTTPTQFGAFADVMFEENSPLFDPREFTDPEGRRYLVWKTLDLPETSRTFEQMPEGLVESLWRRTEARTLATEAAEALASRIRKETDEGGIPSDTLDRIATEEGLVTRSTGPRRRIESNNAFSPIDPSEELRDAMFGLGDSGENGVAVASDRRGDSVLVLAFYGRADSSVGRDVLATSGIDFQNVLSNLPFFMQSDVDRATEMNRVESVIDYLRKEAGIDPNWTPETPGRG